MLQKKNLKIKNVSKTCFVKKMFKFKMLQVDAVSKYSTF